jgi:hypothetical protein
MTGDHGAVAAGHRADCGRGGRLMALVRLNLLGLVAAAREDSRVICAGGRTW